MEMENFFVGCSLAMSLIGFLVTVSMNIHTITWYYKRKTKESRVNKPIFITATVCMTFLSIYLLNEFIIIVLDAFYSFSFQIGCIYDSVNDVIYRIAKCWLYLFFIARYAYYLLS